MGYDGKPIGPDLTIVTVVLRYGVFAREYDGIQYKVYCFIQILYSSESGTDIYDQREDLGRETE